MSRVDVARQAPSVRDENHNKAYVLLFGSDGRDPTARNLNYAGRMVSASVRDRAELVALLRERPKGLTWTQIAGRVLESGSAGAVRRSLGMESLFATEEYDPQLREALQDVQEWEAENLGFWTITDSNYPARIRDIQEAPPFLFSRGHLVSDDVAVSVVGSRKASGRGLQMATAISERLVDMDVTVVAGLAAGIDTAAHETALRLGGRTVAFIGTGIRKHYPAANRGLQDRIARDGLLVSQFWPDAPPQRQNFPMRNAVMSGYGIATVVVEAGEYSGARIQARLAVHHGRPVVLTDLVVDTTEWGRELVGKPDVHVAHSVDEIAAIVGDLLQRPADLQAMLQQIAI